jgi:hypothetical protein
MYPRSAERIYVRSCPTYALKRHHQQKTLFKTHFPVFRRGEHVDGSVVLNATANGLGGNGHAREEEGKEEEKDEDGGAGIGAEKYGRNQGRYSQI